MNKKERVILIKGDSSKWYDQAIFIVKENALSKENSIDFVAEAEKIISNHINKNKGRKSGPNIGIAYASVPKSSESTIFARGVKSVKNKLFDLILNALMTIGCLIIAVALIWGLLR